MRHTLVPITQARATIYAVDGEVEKFIEKYITTNVKKFSRLIPPARLR
jgi:hypothetical protein